MAPNGSRMNEPTRFGLPSGLSNKFNSAPTAGLPATNNGSTAGRHQAPEGSVTACFIIPGNAQVTDGMVQLVHNDLQFANGASLNMEFREQVPYIRFAARTEEEALALVRGAQELGSKNLAGCPPQSQFKFVELPADSVAENFQIVITTRLREAERDENGRGLYFPHICVDDIPGTGDLLGESALEEYERNVSQCIYEALQESATIRSPLSTQVYLGHFMITTWKDGKYTLDQFEKMVRHPRAEGKFHTGLGKTHSAGEPGIEAAMRLIQGTGSPCVPMDNQTATTADVIPTYVLESWHKGDRFETELDKIKGGKIYESGNASQEFALGRTWKTSVDAQTPRFEASSIGIGVGRKLDWKITATLDNKKTQVTPAVMRYFQMGAAVMEGSRHDFHSYPAINLPKTGLAQKLESVAIKSIYRFNWMNTGYVVQVTISRRWETVITMNKKPPREADFEITIHADNWAQEDLAPGTRESVGTFSVGDIESLSFDGEGGAEMGDRLSKARGLLKTIQDIRGFFETLENI